VNDPCAPGALLEGGASLRVQLSEHMLLVLWTLRMPRGTVGIVDAAELGSMIRRLA
jgi:hypothetical protein